MERLSQQWQSADLDALLLGAYQQRYILALITVVGISILTRIITGIQYGSFADHAEGPRRPPVLPSWFPYIGHIFPYAYGAQDWMAKKGRSNTTGIFQIQLGTSKHNIITSPSLTNQIVAPRAPVNSHDFICYTLRTFFGDRGTFGRLNSKDPNIIWTGLHKVLNGMQREPFLGNAVDFTIDSIEKEIFNMVSGNSSLVDQAPWERSARVEVLKGSSKSGSDELVVEASLHPLLRDFLSNIANEILMGRAFVENNPDFLKDMFHFDSKFILFLLGLPYWIVPTLGPAAYAREKCIKAVQEHHEAMFRQLDSKDPGSKYDDLSDVNSIMWGRVKEYKKLNVGPDFYGAGDLAIVWAINANAPQVTFWLVWHILNEPGLLQEIRKEIAPYVKLEQPKDTGLPIKEPPRLKLDGIGLRDKCPLLKSTFYETMRLDVGSFMYRFIHEDFVVTESEEDAKTMGRSKPESYLLKKGELVGVPNLAHVSDDRYFSDPQKFDARRFWTKKQNEKGEEIVDVELGTVRPFGGGNTMCKGRSFAFQEVTLFAAAFISAYDVQPVKGNKFKDPGKKATPGTFVPAKDTRVKIRKRTS